MIRYASRSNHGRYSPAAFFTSRSNDASAASNSYPACSRSCTWPRIFAISALSWLISYFAVFVRMVDCPDSSETRIRRSLPTNSGVMCSYVAGSFATACVCIPPLWANALKPTNGCPLRKFMFASS